MIEDNQTLDGTFNYKVGSTKTTWMTAKYFVTIKFGHSYKSIHWGRRDVCGEACAKSMAKDKQWYVSVSLWSEVIHKISKEWAMKPSYAYKQQNK